MDGRRPWNDGRREPADPGHGWRCSATSEDLRWRVLACRIWRRWFRFMRLAEESEFDWTPGGDAWNRMEERRMAIGMQMPEKTYVDWTPGGAAWNRMEERRALIGMPMPDISAG